MPTTILHKESLIPGRTSKLVLDAPQIAATAKPGHFVMLRVNEQGERFPLTIADTDPEKGTITIVYLVMGKSTMMLEALSEGDSILDVAGPLGKATHIVKGDSVICVGGGTGIAAMHHIAKGHHKAGNYVIAIIGARSKDLLLFENELKSFCDEVLISGSRCRGSGAHDASRSGHDAALRRGHDRQLELAYGGRHRDVRRVPRDS